MIQLTMNFLDNTTDKKITAIYNKYKGKGRELGEFSIKHTDKVKTLQIEENKEETEEIYNINDFTTECVLTYKIESIKSEKI